MSMRPAMRSASRATSAAGSAVCSSSAIAAACAYGPPLPIAATPSSGSMTSPVPLSTKRCSGVPTMSSASSRRSARSCRQSFASSTAARTTLSLYADSLPSNFSSSVIPSAALPANPASTVPFAIARTLRAPCFITVLSTVTCPSPAMAILPSRRTAQIVVDRIRIPSSYSGQAAPVAPGRCRGPRGGTRRTMPPDLVIFDCDGVLVDSEPVVTRVESQYFGTLGFTMDEHEMRRRFQGKTVGDVAAAVETQLGRALAPEELYAWGIATASALAESLRAVPGVTDVVDLVRTSGTPVCVASQSPLPRVRLSLAVTNLAAPFGGRIFTASMVARPKPAPDLFLHAAARMDAQPSRCIVIEDSL